MRDIYLTDDRRDAEVLVDKAIVGGGRDDVPAIQALERTLVPGGPRSSHHDNGASNGPTEGMNLAAKRAKRCGYGFRRFEHYRLRVLLHAGGVTWPRRPSPRGSEPAGPTQTLRAPLPAHYG